MNQADKDYKTIIELFPDIAKYENNAIGINFTDTNILNKLLKLKI